MIEANHGRRVVITGLGVVSPAGTGVEAFWAGLRRAPEPAVIRRVVDFEPERWGIRHVDAMRMDPFAQYAVAAAVQAVADAGLDAGTPYAEERCGVVLGTGIGGAYAREAQDEVFLAGGGGEVSPQTIPMIMPSAGAAAVSRRFGWRGPVETWATACAAGTHAVAHGAKLVAAGRCDAVLVGGSEACQNRLLSSGFTNMKALSPTGVSRPFDVDRDGFCSAEAAGVLVLEDAAAATARGAHIYAEIAGCGSTADAHHITAPCPDGRGAIACMRAALADAGLQPDQVTHVNAHGTSTQLNDATESLAVDAVFGAARPAITSIKGVTGHSLGAAGAIEAVALALSYHHRELPPTLGTRNVDPSCDIDLVTEPRAWTPGPALSNSFAFGGHNATVVFVPA